MSVKPATNQEYEFYHPDLFVMPENGAKPYLLGYLCQKCGKTWFPKAVPCPECWSEDIIQIPLSRVGKLYSYSTVHVGQKGIQTPYVIGYVDLPENVRVFAQLDMEPAELKIGMDVEVTAGVTRVDPNGVKTVSYKFKAVPAD